MLAKSNNTRSHARYKIMIGLLVLLIAPQVLSANTTSPQRTAIAKYQEVFEKGKAKVYQFLSKQEYLIAPITAAIAGGKLCGLPCAAGGAAVGALDELSLFVGLTKKHYLTFGMFGAAIGHMFNPTSNISNMAGFSLGILYKVDMPQNSKQRLLPGLVSAIATGNPAGVVLGMIDELAVYHGITETHMLTAMAIGNKLATQLFDTKLASAKMFAQTFGRLGFEAVDVFDFTGAVLGSAIGAVLAEQEVTLVASAAASLQEAKKIQDFQHQFASSEQLDGLAEKQEMVVIGGYLGLDMLNTQMATYVQALNHHLEHLGGVVGQEWNKYLKALGNYAIFIFPCTLMKAVTNGANDYFADRRRHAWEERLQDKFFSEEAFLRLSQGHNVSTTITTLEQDINKLIHSDSQATETIAATLSGISGIGVLIIHSPDTFVYSLLYKQAQAFISSMLWQQASASYDKARETNEAHDKIVARYSEPENIKTIMAMGGSNGFMQQELRRLNALTETYNKATKLWNGLSNQWGYLSRSLGFLIEQTVIGYNIKQGKITDEQKGKVMLANANAMDLVEKLGRNQQVMSLSQALDRITTLQKIIDSPIAGDQINRVNTTGNQLILHNLNMQVDDHDGTIKSTVVKVDDIKLELGKAYAFDGCSGGGKSLLLTKINRVVANGVRGTGDIYYPLVNGKEAKIVLVTQAKYFESNTSLHQVIVWPEQIPGDLTAKAEQKQLIQELLKKLGLVNFMDSLDSVKDSWDAILSPGQQRRVKLISAFIKAVTQKPDILILDETFTGIDSKRIKIMQELLKEHLPKALILVVDHHASDNNHNHFYQEQKLHLENGVVTMQDIELDGENCGDD